jgi:hypothetical protein
MGIRWPDIGRNGGEMYWKPRPTRTVVPEEEEEEQEEKTKRNKRGRRTERIKKTRKNTNSKWGKLCETLNVAI